MTYAVKVVDLCKTYRIYSSSVGRALDAFGVPVRHKNFEALKSVSLEFEQGEVIAILGKNGSGKSTLLKIVTGVVAPTSGTVEVKGRISAMLELTSGFDSELTGLENIYLKALTMGISRQEIEGRKEEIIRFADIGDHINQPFRTYSSGMKARLGFAVAVSVNPDILIVDEVLAVGDDIFKLKCIDKMNEFRLAGKTILFVSHSLFTVKAFCTRGIWINRGKVMAQGSMGEVVIQYENFLKEERARIKQEALDSSTDADQRGIEKDDLLKVQGMSIRNSKGEKTTTFTFREDICFGFDYIVKQKLDALKFCFTVRDAETNEIFMCDKQSHVIDNTIGTHHLKVKLPKQPLMPGTYLLSGELWETSSGFSVGYSNRRPITIVQDEFIGTGTTFIEHILTVD